MSVLANEPATGELVKKARAGDDRAFGQLMSNWQGRIYNYALRYSGRDAFAQEVVQRTFIQVYQKLDQLQNNDRFVPWLYRIATNCCHTEQRSHKSHQARFSQADQLPEVEDGESPGSLYERAERKQWVRKMLQEIPPAQREVILLKEYEGLKFREIAELLGESENTIKSRLYYGLEAMRRLVHKQKN